MEINSQSGTNQLEKDIIIHFPEGLIGFEEMKDYKLFSSETEDNLHWLQPVDNESIEFAVTFPQVYQVEYEVSLDDEEEKLLNIEGPDELTVLVTLSKKNPSQDTASHLQANFIAPIIININKKLGLQKILSQQENPITITMKG